MSDNAKDLLDDWVEVEGTPKQQEKANESSNATTTTKSTTNVVTKEVEKQTESTKQKSPSPLQTNLKENESNSGLNSTQNNNISETRNIKSTTPTPQTSTKIPQLAVKQSAARLQDNQDVLMFFNATISGTLVILTVLSLFS